MTRDWMRAATMMDYTAFEVHYAAFARGKKRQIEKMAKRAARRITKQELKKIDW